jgi:mRNA export factor
MGDLSNDHSLSLPGNIGDVSYLEFKTFGSSEFLLSSHWDCKVRAWEIFGGNNSGSVHSLPRFEVQMHEKPILSFAVRGDCLYTASCDGSIRFWNMQSSMEPKILGKHAMPVNHVRYIEECQCILSSSWDGTIAYWDVRTNYHTQHNPLLKIKLPGSVQAIDVQYPLMICASSERDLNIYDLRKPNVVFRVCFFHIINVQ